LNLEYQLNFKLEGDVSVFAGDKKEEFDGPVGIVFDRHHNLYVADSGHHQIKKISPEGLQLHLSLFQTSYQLVCRACNYCGRE
jgi:hypothetical protein